MIRAATALALALAGLAPASTGDRGIDTLLADRIAGPPQRCVSGRELGAPTPIDTRNIVYQGWPRRWWRNTLAAACPALGRNPILVVEPSGGQICRGDRVIPIESGSNIRGAACILGDFVPYAKRAR